LKHTSNRSVGWLKQVTDITRYWQGSLSISEGLKIEIHKTHQNLRNPVSLPTVSATCLNQAPTPWRWPACMDCWWDWRRLKF